MFLCEKRTLFLANKIGQYIMNQKEIQRRLDIFYNIRRCLIGEISKNLRFASAKWNEHSAVFYFFFDKEIDERDKVSLEEVRKRFIQCFDQENMTNCQFQYSRVDEPNAIKYEGECFFARKERYDS